ncbi:MAG: hypothetical protein JO152_10010 [Mycobacteriaceae bacterium]|nr:hypothetical protein [Mycobacteriaceae bacterium]
MADVPAELVSPAATGLRLAMVAATRPLEFWGMLPPPPPAPAPTPAPTPAPLPASGLSADADLYGVDLSALPDLDPYFGLQHGRRVLVEAIARRLSTPAGGLFYDAGYGLDLRDYLNEALTPTELAVLRVAVRAQCLADERVDDADAQVVYDPRARTLTVTIRLVAGQGPFAFVLRVDQVNVELLTAA